MRLQQFDIQLQFPATACMSTTNVRVSAINLDRALSKAIKVTTCLDTSGQYVKAIRAQLV